MIDQIREGSEGTLRSGFLLRILGVRVGLSQTRENQLRVALSAESARLEEWLLVEDALLVDVFSGFDIVDCIDYEAY